MPQRPLRAFVYAIVIWIVGFVWGSIVFMTPLLKSIRPIPYLSSNPAISFPILILWIALAYLLARSYLRTSSDRNREGVRLGLVFAVMNFILDLLLLVLLLRAGFAYFISLTVWLGYLLLFAVPWLTGRLIQKQTR
ncbi:MAG TPA: hypothetical protein VE863_01375 [Pyrinomonadaceae bacterium]|jgi:hypothetical protein|nr:hypothetical protein [Pyrinomonadaceae bacterium]